MRNRQKGLTLLELLVVLAIFAFAAAAAAPVFGGMSDSLEAKALAEAIGGELKLARSRAVGSGEIAEVFFDSKAGRYHGDAAPDWTPISRKLSLAFSAAGPAAGDADAILYYPDGSSSGGEVTVAAKGRAWIVKAALNGKVSLDEER
jgi:general secretion pathway protein H